MESRYLCERHVVELWMSVAARYRNLTTVTGEPLRVIYPGRMNHGRGADFCDAVIATSHGIAKGDIEVHRKSSDWEAHGHHDNPDYNGVVLQVALTQDGRGQAVLQDGREIPLLTLERFADLNVAPGRKHRAAGCRSGSSITSRTVARLLDSAGDERFRSKASRFCATGGEVRQSLYRELMAALGYSRNKPPFLELARRLPLRVVESSSRGLPDEEYLLSVQALLVGTAGLLPSQRGFQDSDDTEADILERLWSQLRAREAMMASAWDLFRVRPNNSPVRRLIAMSYLLLRYRDEGLAAGIVSLVKEAPPETASGFLEAGLTVTIGGYWAGHHDFGKGCRQSGALLGGNRAADIVVNVLLPFALAWSRSCSDTGLERKCLALYRAYPPLASNGIVRHMTAQLRAQNLVDSARRQQGLLHIYRELCTQGKCVACPLGQV